MISKWNCCRDRRVPWHDFLSPGRDRASCAVRLGLPGCERRDEGKGRNNSVERVEFVEVYTRCIIFPSIELLDTFLETLISLREMDQGTND